MSGALPTSGIGSSIFCDGQILVINDILNTDNTLKKPHFVKSYSNLFSPIRNAVNKYTKDVKMKRFPKK